MNAPTSGPPTSTGTPSARSWRRRLAVPATIALVAILGGCQAPTFGGFKGSTSQAQNTSRLWSGTVIVGIVVGVIVGSLILWAIFRYRRRSDDVPRQFQHHTVFELIYTIVPIVIVLVLFGFTFVSENEVDHIEPNPAVRVHVTAFQWGWRFDYTNKHVFVQGALREDPDDIGLNGETCEATAADPEDCWGPGLVVPAGETTEITLTSNDVIHSFYVPAFNFSRYAQPGWTNMFDFNVSSTPDIYRAQCNEICGLYHSQMYFHVVALPPAQFQAWLDGNLTGPLASTGPLPDSDETPIVSGSAQSNDTGGPTSPTIPKAYPSSYPPVVQPCSSTTNPGAPTGSCQSPAGTTSADTTTTTSASPTTTSRQGGS